MSSATTFYDLKAEQPKGTFDFSQLKGKVVLVSSRPRSTK
jgi:hypothetical protein